MAASTLSPVPRTRHGSEGGDEMLRHCTSGLRGGGEGFRNTTNRCRRGGGGALRAAVVTVREGATDDTRILVEQMANPPRSSIMAKCSNSAAR